MILKLKELQDLCKTILGAVDGSSTSSIISETLELKTENRQLLMSVTNREYFVTVKMNINTDDNLNAVVEASLFLNLISKLTSEDVDLFTVDNALKIKANGSYSLPFITDNNGVITLTPIEINNKTLEFGISTDILNSILQYNTKELSPSKKLSLSSPIQKLYYIDEQGAITFTTGACVNSFSLERPVKMLLNAKLIKLFGLFKGTNVAFTLGYDEIDGKIQTKIRLEDDNITITAIILNDESMLASVPVDAIRSRANSLYNHTININKNDLLQTINRLMLFKNNDRQNYIILNFDKTAVTLFDAHQENSEVISYTGTTLNNLTTPYSVMVDVMDIKSVVESSIDKYLTISFGDNQAIMIARGQIKNIIPEVHIV